MRVAVFLLSNLRTMKIEQVLMILLVVHSKWYSCVARLHQFSVFNSFPNALLSCHENYDVKNGNKYSTPRKRCQIFQRYSIFQNLTILPKYDDVTQLLQFFSSIFKIFYNFLNLFKRFCFSCNIEMYSYEYGNLKAFLSTCTIYDLV